MEALGWNIYDIREVREEVAKEGVRWVADCVLYLSGSPTIVWEFKPLNTTIEFPDQSTPKDLIKTKKRKLQISKALTAKYFIMSSFSQTVICNVKSGKRIMGGSLSINDTNYKRYKRMLWNNLSKEACQSRAN